MSTKTGAKPKDEYIFSDYDQLEWDAGVDDYVFTAEDHPDFRSSTERLPGAGDLPKKYIVIYSTDEGFEYSAKGYYNAIKNGGYEYDSLADRVYLIKVGDVEGFNNALKKYNNIYAIFIFAHSYYRSRGFTFSEVTPEGEEKSKYNITSDRQKDGTPIWAIYKPNMVSSGYIQLFTCNAAEDGLYDISTAMANHFEAPVLSCSSKVSFWPVLRRAEGKTGVWTNPSRFKRDQDKSTGFKWTSPLKKKRRKHTWYLWP
jgi:hypothetical protein